MHPSCDLSHRFTHSFDIAATSVVGQELEPEVDDDDAANRGQRFGEIQEPGSDPLALRTD